jgi:S-adenosylmethionine hydrolase
MRFNENSFERTPHSFEWVMGIITLLTDFGTQDEYVGVVKGVILSINPQATIVDISHQIAPQGILQAADTLKAAYRWFPEGTVHLVVVDPGVGSQRAIIAARYAGFMFVAPDNGLLNPLWEAQTPQTLVRVDNRDLFLHPVSATFHGRDIFAPVAAHLSLGFDLAALGPVVASSDLAMIQIQKPVWDRKHDDIRGNVTGVDHFGNLITNIDSAMIETFAGQHCGRRLIIFIGNSQIDGISSTYAERAKGILMALVGSRNRLEIAVNGGNAAQRFSTPVGLAVRIGLAP